MAMNLNQRTDTVTPSSGTLNISGAVLPTTPLGYSGGGTGLSTLGTSGQGLVSNGTAVIWSSASAGASGFSGFSGYSGFASTTGSYQIGSLGVGTPASGTAGEIRATNNVTAFYSDDRLKTKLGNIENALEKLRTLNGFYYEANETAQALGYEVIREVGVSAQQVQSVLPEIVVPAPIDAKYWTVRYEKLIALVIEAVKELADEVDKIKK